MVIGRLLFLVKAYCQGRTVSFWECTFFQLLPFPFSLSGRFGSEVPKCFHALEETFAPQDLSFPRATPLSLLPPASALWVWKKKMLGLVQQTHLESRVGNSNCSFYKIFFGSTKISWPGFFLPKKKKHAMNQL